MAYIIAILLFMAILLYGVNVMSSVLEEKRDRIVEVLASSLRPFQRCWESDGAARSVFLP
jgi:ABC-2 type transport system permease protein